MAVSFANEVNPVESIKTALSSSTPEPTTAARKPEAKKSEGRGIGRMEVTDAQLEMALKDKRYLQRQLKCTLGEAPCDPVGRRLKSKRSWTFESFDLNFKRILMTSFIFFSFGSTCRERCLSTVHSDRDETNSKSSSSHAT